MTVFNFLILLFFVPAVMLICWMIWHEEDLIEFEQKMKRKIRRVFRRATAYKGT